MNCELGRSCVKFVFGASLFFASNTALADSHVKWTSADVNRATSSLRMDQLAFCFQISRDVMEANGFTDALNVVVANEEDLFRLWSLSSQVTVERTRDVWGAQNGFGRIEIVMLSQEDAERFNNRVTECGNLVTGALQAIQELGE